MVESQTLNFKKEDIEVLTESLEWFLMQLKSGVYTQDMETTIRIGKKVETTQRMLDYLKDVYKRLD